MKCRIAELNIEFNNRGKHFERIAEKYRAEFSAPDITVSATDEDIAKEKADAGYLMQNGVAETVVFSRRFAHCLPEYDAFMLHSATFSIRGRGIGFLAKSGTGKSTHMLSWKELFGDELKIINGDKPVVRFFDGLPYAYGTPWCGKEGYSINDRVILTDICFITRSNENKAVLLDKSDNIAHRLLGQVSIPAGSENIIKALELVERLAESCRFWEIYCTADSVSAEVSSSIILR